MDSVDAIWSSPLCHKHQSVKIKPTQKTEPMRAFISRPRKHCIGGQVPGADVASWGHTGQEFSGQALAQRLTITIVKIQLGLQVPLGRFNRGSLTINRGDLGGALA